MLMRPEYCTVSVVTFIHFLQKEKAHLTYHSDVAIFPILRRTLKCIIKFTLRSLPLVYFFFFFLVFIFMLLCYQVERSFPGYKCLSVFDMFNL